MARAPPEQAVSSVKASKEKSVPNDSRTAVRVLRGIAEAAGPGLITGAADDDPSGIATYSIAGAQLGTQLLWTAWLPGR